MFHLNKGIWTLGIPAVLSVMTVVKHSVILFALLVVIHFIILRIVPAFKGRENLWMFIFVAISSIPLNIYILTLVNEWELLFGTIFVLGILRCILYYAILFSVEEIIMGVITRLIWRRQYKLVL